MRTRWIRASQIVGFLHRQKHILFSLFTLLFLVNNHLLLLLRGCIMTVSTLGNNSTYVATEDRTDPSTLTHSIH